MASLSSQWLTEGWIDFEYKKYQLLAFLQDVSNHFQEKKLYPRLSELIAHYENLQLFREQKKIVSESFPQKISKLDFEQFKVEYESLITDDELMQELEDIVNFALPKIQDKLEEGKELYEMVSSNMEIFPVGIVPLRNEEGYFMLSDFLQKLISVYYYHMTLFESAREQYRAIKTRHIADYSLSIRYNYETIRYELLEKNKDLPNPATYVIEFKQSYPLPETMLPVAKKTLVRMLLVSK
ncbi:MAG: hypothetical protein RMJ53_06495 [Chitinophagales bacterium]|nr:hypothetical protein [Chitinophagales bacterium]